MSGIPTSRPANADPMPKAQPTNPLRVTSCGCACRDESAHCATSCRRTGRRCVSRVPRKTHHAIHEQHALFRSLYPTQGHCLSKAKSREWRRRMSVPRCRSSFMRCGPTTMLGRKAVTRRRHNASIATWNSVSSRAWRTSSWHSARCGRTRRGSMRFLCPSRPMFRIAGVFGVTPRSRRRAYLARSRTRCTPNRVRARCVTRRRDTT